MKLSNETPSVNVYETVYEVDEKQDLLPITNNADILIATTTQFIVFVALCALFIVISRIC